MAKHRFIAAEEPSTDCAMVEHLIKQQYPDAGVKLVKEVTTQDGSPEIGLIVELEDGSEKTLQMSIELCEGDPKSDRLGWGWPPTE